MKLLKKSLTATKRLVGASLIMALCAACGPSDENNTTNNNDENQGTMLTPAEQEEAWEMCRMEATEYEQFEETISSIARVGGFERMGDLLWSAQMTPTPSDFEDANAIYVEEEGVASRVVRREDEHYAKVMEGGETLSCRDEGVPEKDVNRCVGPAQINPIVLDSLTSGAMDMGQPEVEAARIEAALLWFLYVSTYKEATTCAQKAKDCDSSFAYYGGGEQKSGGLGLAAYYRAHAPAAHDLVWEGLLAVRCWRGIDDGEEAANTDLQQKALDVLDVGLDYGLSRLVTWRLDEFAANTDVARDADWAFLQILGPALQRAADEVDATKAQALEDAWSGAADDLDVDATRSLIEELFPTP